MDLDLPREVLPQPTTLSSPPLSELPGLSTPVSVDCVGGRSATKKSHYDADKLWGARDGAAPERLSPQRTRQFPPPSTMISLP